MDKDKIQNFLNAWHQCVESKNIQIMDSFVTEEVVLISPALFHPKVGKETVRALLKDVLFTLNQYKITKTWIDGNEILLEFDAMIRDRKVQGIDKITLNEAGKMIQLKVFIRPFSGLKALVASIIQLQMSREEMKMSAPQKLMARTTFALKSKWEALKGN